LRPVRTELASGATVVSEARSGAQSVAVGLYFPTGSRHETLANNGISHFLEHLIFKGTPTRRADEVNREIDLLGGLSNAYTSKEILCFHASVLPEHTGRILALHGDLIAHGLPPAVDEEFGRERAVILQEISAVEDSPEDLVGDLADSAFFGEHSLALPVVGQASAVQRLDVQALRAHARAHLVTDSLVVAAAGRIEQAELVELVERHLADVPNGTQPAAGAPPEPRTGLRLVERDLEQVNLCLSARGVERSDPRHAIADVLSCIVGEGYSSRLFREVRDRRGLAYSVGSSFASYSDAGSWNLWAGVSPDNLAETLDVIGQVLASVRDQGVRSEELEAAREHLRGSLILGHEAPGARMVFLAEQVLIGASDLELQSSVAAVEAVSAGQVQELAAELLQAPLAVAAVGPVPSGVLPEQGWEVTG
jgi:predicted Zn-dependent peptidase